MRRTSPDLINRNVSTNETAKDLISKAVTATPGVGTALGSADEVTASVPVSSAPQAKSIVFDAAPLASDGTGLLLLTGPALITGSVAERERLMYEASKASAVPERLLCMPLHGRCVRAL